MTLKFLAYIIATSIVILSLAGCAATNETGGIKKIGPKELIDSLLVKDSILDKVKLSGKGTFFTGENAAKFNFTVVANRKQGKMLAQISGPLGIGGATLWLCGKDSLCIFLPQKNAVMVEPLGAHDSAVILPPAAPVMIDMFCGMSPLGHFADSLRNFEQVAEKCYLTFQKNGEVLVITAEPNPWRVTDFQWLRLSNTDEMVDVTFDNGAMKYYTWRPDKITISAPAQKQRVLLNIHKEQFGLELTDSTFVPELPENVSWFDAY
jgi:hypothetical protein